MAFHNQFHDVYLNIKAGLFTLLLKLQRPQSMFDLCAEYRQHHRLIMFVTTSYTTQKRDPFN